MTTELNLKSNSVLEFAFGRVLPGAEQWMGETYFAAMGPLMAKNGIQRLAASAVIATNAKGAQPQTAVFSEWPTAENRAAFMNDPAFIAIRDERDARLELSDGHLFEPIDEVIMLNTDSDYAIVISDDQNALPEPIFSLPLSEDTHADDYKEKAIALAPWNDAAETLMRLSPELATVFRVRFEGA